ncbi:unnamed protein product [Ixodes pacificus]
MFITEVRFMKFNRIVINTKFFFHMHFLCTMQFFILYL